MAVCVITILIISIHPQVIRYQIVSAEQISQDDLAKIIAENTPLADLGSDDEYPASVEIITVGNWWGNCTYYILPHYSFSVRDISYSGQNSWIASLDFTILCSNENSLAAKLCNLELRDAQINVIPGENTAAMTITHSDLFSTSTEWERKALCPINILKTPSISDSFTVLTTVSNSTPNLETSADCTWSYTLYCCGTPVGESQIYTLTQPYMVDCTSE